MDKAISVVGILVDDRGEFAPQVQQVLTRHGQSILMRSGTPSPDREKGIIMLTMECGRDELSDLVKELEGIKTVKVKGVTLS